MAFVDTDTLFITVMTYELLFDEQARPRVAGQLGPPSDQHWANISANTELWFGKPEVVRGMFAFPVRSLAHTAVLVCLLSCVSGMPERDAATDGSFAAPLLR